jgi:hypothetical protein
LKTISKKWFGWRLALLAFVLSAGISISARAGWFPVLPINVFTVGNTVHWVVGIGHGGILQKDLGQPGNTNQFGGSLFFSQPVQNETQSPAPQVH